MKHIYGHKFFFYISLNYLSKTCYLFRYFYKTTVTSTKHVSGNSIDVRIFIDKNKYNFFRTDPTLHNFST